MCIAAAILGLGLTGITTQAQPQPIVVFGQSAQEPNTRAVRQEFNDLLNAWYPPSLRNVLQLDPSLMKNAEYLKAYPKLGEFLAQHPEVASNPTYFVGTYEPEVRYERLGVNFVEPLAVLTVFVIIVGALLWIIRAVVDHRRWIRVSKLQTEAHTKILERFGSNEDLLNFIQTPAGKRFLESSAIPIEPRSIGAPVGRILWSVQLGFVLLLAGVGMGFLSYAQSLNPEAVQALFVMGGLIMATGLGFLLSGIASYVISRRLGLFVSNEASETGTQLSA
jgi:cytochrome c biogenesis protein CcdA